jgi:hypothetical protein
MKDIISQATSLVSSYAIRYNPGMPLTFDYRPVTIAPKYKGTMGNLTPPGTNIYRDKLHKLSDSYVMRDNLNAKYIFNLFSGNPGYHTDYTGLIMCAFFQNSPDEWCKLFNTCNTRLTYPQVLFYITGLTTNDASKFVNLNSEYFPLDVLNGQDLTPTKHEQVLRKLQDF